MIYSYNKCNDDASKLDLRFLYVHPEQDKEYFDVAFEGNEYQMKTMLRQSLQEDRLPAEVVVVIFHRR